MRKSLFFLVVFVAALAKAAPVTHSASASAVRSNSNLPFTAFHSSPSIHASPAVTSHTDVSFLAFSQVQSQFLRLADQLDTSIHRFRSSQSVADLEEIDDSINALERRSNSPATTSLTLRSYLAQREQILCEVAALAVFLCSHVRNNHCILTLDTQVLNATASQKVSQQPRHSARIHAPYETRFLAENGPRVIAIAVCLQTRDVLLQD